MKIKSSNYYNIKYSDKDETKMLELVPGDNIFNKVPIAQIAKKLFVLRKHGFISFDFLLPGDTEIIKEVGLEAFKEKVSIKPSPNGRQVKGVAKKNVGRKKTKAKTPKKKKSQSDINWQLPEQQENASSQSSDLAGSGNGENISS